MSHVKSVFTVNVNYSNRGLIITCSPLSDEVSVVWEVSGLGAVSTASITDTQKTSQII